MRPFERPGTSRPPRPGTLPHGASRTRGRLRWPAAMCIGSLVGALIGSLGSAGSVAAISHANPDQPSFSRPDPAPVTPPPSGVEPGSVDRTSIDLTATYDVRAFLRFTPAQPTIRVTTDIAVTNTSGGPIDRLELNLVPIVIGGAELGPVTVDGASVQAHARDQTLMVPLGGILVAGSSTTVSVEYTARFETAIAGSDWLFARRSGIVQAYRWIPWISRVTPFERPNFGDPFVTPVSPHVRVTIVSDTPLEYAATGERIDASSGYLQQFDATMVRDFSFTAARTGTYRTVTGLAGDGRTRVVVRYATLPGKLMLHAAIAALDAFTARIGDYPYATFTVAEASGVAGLESPALIWIPQGLAANDVTYLVTHETAHQWFYAVVGNDQARQPFADEAPTDFLTRSLLHALRASRCAPGALDRSIYGYTAACYHETIYVQGSGELEQLRRLVGPTAFWAGLRDYYETYRFRIGGTKALLQAIDDHTPLDLARDRYPTRFPSICWSATC